MVLATHRGGARLASLAEVIEPAETDLSTVPEGSEVSDIDLISGIAAHDLYHAGQIQLLKQLGVKDSDRCTRRPLTTARLLLHLAA